MGESTGDRQNSNTAQPGIFYFFFKIKMWKWELEYSPMLALENEKREKNITASVSEHRGTQAY